MIDSHVQIGHRIISASARPYIIAEIGVNHDGSADRALTMIDAAADAGAHAVKFQYFKARNLLSRAADLARYQRSTPASSAADLLHPLELTESQLARCLEHAHSCGMHAIVTIFSIEHVSAIASLPWDAFKVASPDVINQPLIEALIAHAADRPMLLSTGAAELAEIARALLWVREHPHAIMHCISSYPTPMEAAELGAIRALQQLTPLALGYSDHTPDVLTGALAVAAGARLLEKHSTWNRAAAGPDHAASLDAAQLHEYIDLAQRAFASLGCGEKRCTEIERDVMQVARQSIVATRAMSAGHVLMRDDVTIKRPGTGLPPYMLRQIVGATLRRSIEADTPIMTEDISNSENWSLPGHSSSHDALPFTPEFARKAAAT